MASGQNPWMATKYNIMEQEAAAKNAAAYAQADLLKAQAAATPGEANARNIAARGQGAAGSGQGTLDIANAGQVGGLASSEIQQRAAATGLTRAQTMGAMTGLAPAPGDLLQRAGQGSFMSGLPGLDLSVPQPTMSSPAPQPGLGGAPVGGPNDVWQNPQPAQFATGTSMVPSHGQQMPNAWSGGLDYSGLSKGTSKVPGKGDGKTDTQAAMLAPGEAVLNKAAAEHLGRDTISFLNELGKQKMGLTDQGSQNQNSTTATDQGTTQGYAGGTSKVPGKNSPQRDNQAATEAPKKASAKPAGGPAKKSATPVAGKVGKAAPGPAALSPGLLAALMQMGGGGAGMPQPGQPPMPMPMPMTGGPAPQMPMPMGQR